MDLKVKQFCSLETLMISDQANHLLNLNSVVANFVKEYSSTVKILNWTADFIFIARYFHKMLKQNKRNILELYVHKNLHFNKMITFLSLFYHQM